jgi:hypothetical protein
MTYYFFHIKFDTPLYKGHASGVQGFYESEAPDPAAALGKIKEYVLSKFPHLEMGALEVTQFNNVI